MKKLGLMVVGAFFTLATTSAVAQTVTPTKAKTTNLTPRRNGNVTIDGQTVKQKPGVAQQRTGTAAKAGQQYSTSPRDGVNTYDEQTNNDHQGATAENGEETVTVVQKDAAKVTPAKTTTSTKKTAIKTSSSTKVRP
ncbi:hypothetical protein [Mucilaginibacter antarcticus]|uniref:Uncharacterized protein n=1 Tax=Mucilaginibacter antarcticus TaxID=1855725 RepID=A0ABW5XPW7_9SPHI